MATKKIVYCFECSSFPCARLKTLDRRYRERYGMSMIENLRFIQARGMKKFIEKEQERWRCSSCGGVVCAHNRKCYACGHTLERS